MKKPPNLEGFRRLGRRKKTSKNISRRQRNFVFEAPQPHAVVPVDGPEPAP